MKYVQTIWRINSAQSTADRESWLGSLVATIETEFPISCSFVVLPEHRQRVLNWLQAKAVGPYSVEELPDGRIAVALGDRHDAVRLRAFHWHCLDHRRDRCEPLSRADPRVLRPVEKQAGIMTLRQIYNSLHAAGLVTSQRQFSREWLQKQPSYILPPCRDPENQACKFCFIIYDRIRRLALLSADGVETSCQHREQLRRLATEIRSTIGRRLSVGSSDC